MQVSGLDGSCQIYAINGGVKLSVNRLAPLQSSTVIATNGRIHATLDPKVYGATCPWRNSLRYMPLDMCPYLQISNAISLSYDRDQSDFCVKILGFNRRHFLHFPYSRSFYYDR